MRAELAVSARVLQPSFGNLGTHQAIAKRLFRATAIVRPNPFVSQRPLPSHKSSFSSRRTKGKHRPSKPGNPFRLLLRLHQVAVAAHTPTHPPHSSAPKVTAARERGGGADRLLLLPVPLLRVPLRRTAVASLLRVPSVPLLRGSAVTLLALRRVVASPARLRQHRGREVRRGRREGDGLLRTAVALLRRTAVAFLPVKRKRERKSVSQCGDRAVQLRSEARKGVGGRDVLLIAAVILLCAHADNLSYNSV